LSATPSNAPLASNEKSSFARVADIYAALPAITGKLELEYEGELKGADTIARELIRTAVGRVFSKHFPEVNFQPVIQWFETGRRAKASRSGYHPRSVASSSPKSKA